jgi:hypothetical protein
MSRRKSRFRNRQARTTGPARVERSPREPVAATTPADLARQYHYVVDDLNRIGIVAALLVGTMILLRIFVIK